MKQEGLRERMELLEIGEKLGWPRLGYGRSTKIPHDKRIPQGKAGWEKFCAVAHVKRVYPALRIGRVLRDNNVEVFHPLSGKELAPPALSIGDLIDLDRVQITAPPTDLLEDIAVGKFAPEIHGLNTKPETADGTRRKRGGHKRPPHPDSKRNRSTAS